EHRPSSAQEAEGSASNRTRPTKSETPAPARQEVGSSWLFSLIETCDQLSEPRPRRNIRRAIADIHRIHRQIVTFGRRLKISMDRKDYLGRGGRKARRHVGTK